VSGIVAFACWPLAGAFGGAGMSGNVERPHPTARKFRRDFVCTESGMADSRTVFAHSGGRRRILLGGGFWPPLVLKFLPQRYARRAGIRAATSAAGGPIELREGSMRRGL